MSEATQGETSQAKLPFSRVVTGSEVNSNTPQAGLPVKITNLSAFCNLMRCLGVGMHTDPGNCDQRVHLQVAEILKDSKTDDVTVLDVRPRQCDFTDEMVIGTARSKLHCQSAAQAVVYRVRLTPFIRLSRLQAE